MKHIDISPSLESVISKLRKTFEVSKKTMPDTFLLYEVWFALISKPSHRSVIKELEGLIITLSKKELGDEFKSISINEAVGTIFINRKSGKTIFANGSFEVIDDSL